MIFGLINKDSGPGFHRIMMPLLHMKDTDVHITNAASEELFDQKRPTAIYYNRIISDEILKLKEVYNFKTVVDFDDHWHLDPSHILYQYHYENNMPAHHIKHIELADEVTCTHERLAEKIYKYNRNVHVLPNAIPKNSEHFPVIKTESPAGLKRVFWQGSVTHEHDINLLRGPIKRLDKNKFLMVLAGFMQQEDAWHRMVSAYTNSLQMKGCILPGTSPLSYYNNYQFADVCVAPLRASEFNAHKSNLKILEAAHSGLPVIASGVHPYLGMQGVMYVFQQSQWFKWLNAPKEVHDAYAKELQRYCDEHYNFEKINEQRKQLFI
jgi:glycosyltransferase involved in cell wall biosynthesis